MHTHSPEHLPSLDIETLLGELGRNDGSPRELATGERLDGFLCRLDVLVFDVDLADAEVDAGTSGTGDLDFDDGTIFAALLFNVFLDFYDCVSRWDWGERR